MEYNLSENNVKDYFQICAERMRAAHRALGTCYHV
ncbi:hypothetical protein J2W51_003670 [Tardiphaga robiniae]|nr:hypothetical protein [Tardiphaga robiniae]